MTTRTPSYTAALPADSRITPQQLAECDIATAHTAAVRAARALETLYRDGDREGRADWLLACAREELSTALSYLTPLDTTARRDSTTR